MALLNKGQVRTAVQQAIDDASAKRWTAGNLDILISLVGDMMWEAILETFEQATAVTELETPSSGAIALTALTTQRFYKVLKVVRVSDSKEYQPRLAHEAFPQPTYYINGSNIITDPAIAGASSASVEYSYLPTFFNSLATDGTSLPSEYPEGHELALVYLSAAAAIIKGDAESMAQVARLADIAVEALLTHMVRRYPVGAPQRVAQVKNALMRIPLSLGVANAN